jgi:hypothetical protein
LARDEGLLKDIFPALLEKAQRHVAEAIAPVLEVKSREIDKQLRTELELKAANVLVTLQKRLQDELQKSIHEHIEAQANSVITAESARIRREHAVKLHQFAEDLAKTAKQDQEQRIASALTDERSTQQKRLLEMKKAELAAYRERIAKRMEAEQGDSLTRRRKMELEQDRLVEAFRSKLKERETKAIERFRAQLAKEDRELAERLNQQTAQRQAEERRIQQIRSENERALLAEGEQRRRQLELEFDQILAKQRIEWEAQETARLRAMRAKLMAQIDREARQRFEAKQIELQKELRLSAASAALEERAQLESLLAQEESVKRYLSEVADGLPQEIASSVSVANIEKWKEHGAEWLKELETLSQLPDMKDYEAT